MFQFRLITLVDIGRKGFDFSYLPNKSYFQCNRFKMNISHFFLTGSRYASYNMTRGICALQCNFPRTQTVLALESHINKKETSVSSQWSWVRISVLARSFLVHHSPLIFRINVDGMSLEQGQGGREGRRTLIAVLCSFRVGSCTRRLENKYQQEAGFGHDV